MTHLEARFSIERNTGNSCQIMDRMHSYRNLHAPRVPSYTFPRCLSARRPCEPKTAFTPYPATSINASDHSRKRRLNLNLKLLQRNLAQETGVDKTGVCWGCTIGYLAQVKKMAVLAFRFQILARSNASLIAAPTRAASSLLISPKLPRLSVILRKRVKSVGIASVSIKYAMP